LDQYRMWIKAKRKIEGDGGDEAVDLVMLKRALTGAQKSDSVLRIAMHKETYTGNDVDSFNEESPAEKSARGSLLYLFKANKMMETTNKEFLDGFEEFVSGEERKSEAKDKAPRNY